MQSVIGKIAVFCHGNGSVGRNVFVSGGNHGVTACKLSALEIYHVKIVVVNSYAAFGCFSRISSAETT